MPSPSTSRRAGRVAGKVALVTGAARGQGRSHAVRLAAEGADVVAMDVCADVEAVPYPLGTREDLEETARLVKAAGGDIVTWACDARDTAAVGEMVASALDRFGRLDIAVINHGVLNYGYSADMDDQTWDTMIGINLTSVFRVARASARAMIDLGNGGSIVITSSNYGLKGAGMIAGYVAAKHGVVGLARAMAIDLVDHGIRVNTVNPTTVRTPMVDNPAIRGFLRPDLADPTSEDVEGPLAALHYYAEAWMDPSEVSSAVLYLASDESRCVTGISLPVDMGSLQK